MIDPVVDIFVEYLAWAWMAVACLRGLFLLKPDRDRRQQPIERNP